jgi:hypothetical protein
MLNRSHLFAALSVSIIACGGGGGTIIPAGAHTHYVANQVEVPSNNNEAREDGLDLNGDGTVDNQLGMVLSALASTAGFDIQGSVNKSVAEGTIILLADVQTTDFTNAGAAGISILLGDSANPAACNTGETYTCDTSTPPVCTGCGHQLDGTASFQVAADSPTDAALGGKFVNGTFNGGPGDISLQIALTSGAPITLNLIGARIQASGVTATTIGDSDSGGAILAGALSSDDINNTVLPAVQAQLGPVIAADCTMLTMPPDCGCTAGSTGKLILGFFDTMPQDCAVSLSEIQNNTLIKSLLMPDVTVNGVMALSLGIKTTYVGATFPVTGEM